MQQKVDEAEAYLPHLSRRRAERARALHLLEEFVRDRIACLPMPREKVERLALPTPVLHNLRRQFDEIPLHARSRQRPDLAPAEKVMQQVAELVEDGLHI